MKNSEEKRKARLIVGVVIVLFLVLGGTSIAFSPEGPVRTTDPVTTTEPTTEPTTTTTTKTEPTTTTTTTTTTWTDTTETLTTSTTTTTTTTGTTTTTTVIVEEEVNYLYVLMIVGALVYGFRTWRKRRC